MILGIALYDLGFGMYAAVFLPPITQVSALVGGLYIAGTLLSLLLYPVFYVALFLDAGAVRESASAWTPDRRIWVGGSIIFSLITYLLTRNGLVFVIAFAYLLVRYRNPPVENEPDAESQSGV